MKRILLYENRKQAPIAYNASTPALELNAFLCLFRYLESEWGCYEDMAEEGKTQQRQYEAAKAGSGLAARKLLKLRQGYEYERWRLLDVFDPCIPSPPSTEETKRAMETREE